MKNTYSPEIRQRAVRLYQEQRSEYPTQWAATVSVIPPFLIELMGRKSKALLLFKNRWTTIY